MCGWAGCDSPAVVCWGNSPPLPCRKATGHMCNHISIHRNDSQNRNLCTQNRPKPGFFRAAFNINYKILCTCMQYIVDLPVIIAAVFKINKH